MTKIVSVAEMIAIEKKAEAAGLGYEEMMENAGKSIAERILHEWPEASKYQILVLVGVGNNGGDGLVAGHYLAQAGAQVSFYLLKPRAATDVNLKRVINQGCLLSGADHDPDGSVLSGLLSSADMLLDGVLGTGFRLPLRGHAQTLLAQVKAHLTTRTHPVIVVAIDCPSGVDCDSGEAADETLPADITITLAAVKAGLLKPPGVDLIGQMVVGDIGLVPDPAIHEEAVLTMMDDSLARSWLPSRSHSAHKGSFGRVLIIAGSQQYPGAAILASMGAYRAGCGLVTLAVPEPIVQAIVAATPEATFISLLPERGSIGRGNASQISDALQSADALLVGPGFGLRDSTRDFLVELLSNLGKKTKNSQSSSRDGKRYLSLVVDADALKLLSSMDNWPSRLPSMSILTPHPGEMSVLTGLPVTEIQADRIKIAQSWSERWGHVVVLKGAYTVVACPGEPTLVIPVATPALARAGTGDVLAGAISGLLGQGLGEYQAAGLGAYLHGHAGLIAARELGTTSSVLASDVAGRIATAYSELGG